MVGSILGNGPNTVSESTVSNIELTEFKGIAKGGGGKKPQ